MQAGRQQAWAGQLERLPHGVLAGRQSPEEGGGGAELPERPRWGGAPAARSPGAAGLLQPGREPTGGAPATPAPRLPASVGWGGWGSRLLGAR